MSYATRSMTNKFFSQTIKSTPGQSANSNFNFQKTLLVTSFQWETTCQICSRSLSTYATSFFLFNCKISRCSCTTDYEHSPPCSSHLCKLLHRLLYLIMKHRCRTSWNNMRADLTHKSIRLSSTRTCSSIRELQTRPGSSEKKDDTTKLLQINRR